MFFWKDTRFGEAMDSLRRKAAAALAEGLRKGLSAYLWLLKIWLPVSLATALLEWSGWLATLDFLLQPAMGILRLPAVAALPIVIGLTAGVYGCLAAMAVLPLTAEQMTIVSVVVLIAHNLPQEGIIQARSGISFWKATLVRLAVAAVTAWLVAGWLDPAPCEGGGGPAVLYEKASLGSFLAQWSVQTTFLCLKVFAILLAIMILIAWMKAFAWIGYLVAVFGPLLTLLGLDRRATVLWLTGALFGLAYGGALIMEQSRELDLGAREVEKLQLSIGINHSMIEDPLLFLPFVVSPLYAWLPRLAAAMAVVYLLTLWSRLRPLLFSRG